VVAAVIDRELPSSEAVDLLDLVRDLVQRELAPRADKAEATGSFPREVFAQLGELGLLSLPYPQRFGGGDQPAVVYLQVLEELARGWATVALGVSVHVLSCSGVAEFGTAEQQERFLPEMLSGSTLGAYCLSEAHAGSDAGAMRTRAVSESDEYVISGEKAWITHGPVADFYLLAARTGDDRSHGISTFLLPHGYPGLTAGTPERKMGFRGSVTSTLHLDQVRVGADRRIGYEGQGFRIALSALDSGRLGISACAVGLAQAALNAAAAYAAQRIAFRRPIDEFQGVSFLLADAASQIVAARQLYLYAARRKDAGKPFSTEAAMAKLIATDTAMKVTTDMVQVLGGAGYVEDHPLERYMREAKVLQIVEGTNQIQRVVIARSLKQAPARPA
jgi:alkylation response protein AidB-like acyl-CoA dehydrogenase